MNNKKKIIPLNEALSFCNSNTKVVFKYTANNCPPFFVLDFFSAYSTKSDIFIGLPRKKLSVGLSLDSAFNVISDADIFPIKIQKVIRDVFRTISKITEDFFCENS